MCEKRKKGAIRGRAVSIGERENVGWDGACVGVCVCVYVHS